MMKINEFMKKFEATGKYFSLEFLGARAGPMASSVAEFRGPQISVRLLLDRGEPVVELCFGNYTSNEWFDLNIIQNCILQEERLPVHGLNSQLRFLRQNAEKLKTADFDALKMEIKDWQMKRASEIFGMKL